MIDLFAHAGEFHESALSSSVHLIPWYFQIPLFALLVAGFSTFVWLLTKKVSTVIFITCFGLLLAGFLLYQVAPIVSVLAISFGLISSLAVTLLGIGSGK